jgi:hypothetical protein
MVQRRGDVDLERLGHARWVGEGRVFGEPDPGVGCDACSPRDATAWGPAETALSVIVTMLAARARLESAKHDGFAVPLERTTGEFRGGPVSSAVGMPCGATLAARMVTTAMQRCTPSTSPIRGHSPVAQPVPISVWP